MQRAIGFVLIAALLAVVSAYDCNANLSGGNNASPARWTRSSSCDANLSGDNNASPARFFGSRTAPVCSGKGGCVNGACVCNPGFQGENCEYDCTSTVAPSTAAPTVQLTPRPTTVAPTTTCPPCPCGEANLSGDNNASPARRMRRNGDACPTCKACPTTAAPTTTTAAPTTTTAPPVQLTPKPTTTVAPTTTCAPCPCGSEANLSGDNNASPARRARTACPVCKACPTVAPSTAAPTTTTAAPTTTAPPVQLTPRPTTVAPTTTCPPCPCGSEVNLSGDNNASPARNVRTTCPVCKACPTAAPTTTSPPVQATSPATPTTLAPCWTCPSGFIHWYDAGITVAPGNDRCACVPVATTSSPATSSAPQTSEAPSVGLPICGTPEANLSGDNNASPARNIRSSSCNVNLSGGNNASPARRFRNVYTEAVCNGKGGCVNGGCVCNVGYRGENCEEQYCVVASSTSAPTVNLTPKPATSRAPTQNESGEDNSRESSSATKVTAFFGLIVAIIVSLIL